MTSPGIRAKLTAWFALCLAAGLLVFGAGVFVIFRASLMDEIDRALAEEIIEVVMDLQEHSDDDLAYALERNFADHPFYWIQIIDPSSRVLFSTPANARPILTQNMGLAADDDLSSTLRTSNGTSLRVLVRRVAKHDGNYLVVVGDPLDSYRQASERLLATLLTLGPLALVIVLFGGHWLSRKALAPIDRLTEAAVSITASDLHRRVPEPSTDDEVGRLARAFNEMIGRLEHSFDDTRRFTADAAHELRTPLAVLRTSAEVALRERSDGEQLRAVLRDQIEEIERLGQIADQLLFLCREDAGLHDEATTAIGIDLLLEDLCETLQLSAEAVGVSLSCEATSRCTVVAPPNRLRRLFLNLLDNAIRYSTGGLVEVRVELVSQSAVITIQDKGVGIAPEHLPHVFDRFYRGDQSRNRLTGGSGLGLAICRSIADSLAGKIFLDSQLGHGTTAKVWLPAGVPSSVTGPKNSVVEPSCIPCLQ